MSTAIVTTLGNGAKSVPVDTVVEGTAKVWTQFNQRATQTIIDSFNTSSLTDNGTGDTTINFTAARPDANYAVSGCCLTHTSGSVQGNWCLAGAGTAGANSATTKTVSACRILAGLTNSTSVTDMNEVSFMLLN